LHDRSSRIARTVWIMDPGLVYQAGPEPSSFRLTDPTHGSALDVMLFGSQGTHLAYVHGNGNNPLLGWTGYAHKIVPTQAIVLEQPSDDAWAMNVSALRTAGDEPMRPARLLNWSDPEHWSVLVPGSATDTVISRASATITRTIAGVPVSSAKLVPAPDPSLEFAAVLSSYARDVARYGGPLRELWFYRVRMSAVLLFLAACQQVILGVILRRFPKTGAALSAASLAGWTGVAAWLWFVYF
ncbi:MAG: hypothetical protein ACREFQ_14340, partial [Stellaceae bacterium]